MDIKILTESALIEQTIKHMPNYLKALEEISQNFNKYAKNPKHCDNIVETFGAIICINEISLYEDIPESLLIALKEKTKMFAKAIAYYFEEVDKNIAANLENKSKNVLENMSKEELIEYIKSKENTSK